jgi:hypothetical protein
MSSPLRRKRPRAALDRTSSALLGGIDKGKRALVWGGLVGCLVVSFQNIVFDSVRTTEQFSTVYRSFHERFVDPTASSPAVENLLLSKQFNETTLARVAPAVYPRLLDTLTTNGVDSDHQYSSIKSAVVQPTAQMLPRDREKASILVEGTATSYKESTAEKTHRNFEREWFEECTSILDQEIYRIRPSCNNFHELPIADSSTHEQELYSRSTLEDVSLLSMEGSWRSVWNVTRYPITTANESFETSPPRTLVLKLLQLDREFDKESFSMHDMDAIIMDVLTASPYIVDSYGFCGQSVMTSVAASSGRALVKDSNLKWLTRLQLARDLSRGMADLHALSPLKYETLTINHTRESPLPFAHHDVNIANTIATPDGHIQWNDFNLGLVARHKKTKSIPFYKSCPVPIRYEGALWRSPEEIQNKTGYLNTTLNAMQAADVYSLGNVLFQVLSKHQPWSHLEKERSDKVFKANSTQSINVSLATGQNFTQEEKDDSISTIAQAKMQGQLPYIPERYLSRPEAKVLWDQVQQCYQKIPADRPSALDVALVLGKAYDKYYTKSQKIQPKE